MLCLVNKSIGYQVAQCVVVEDKHFHMDVVFSLANFVEQTEKEVVSLCINLYFVVFKGQSHALVLEQLYQCAVSFRDMKIALFGKFEH